MPSGSYFYASFRNHTYSILYAVLMTFSTRRDIK